jgi:putative DNA-invertase from lambdoid prophage Rac
VEHEEDRGVTCYGYIRVSTTDQADSGLGLQAQRDAIAREYEQKWKPEGFAWGGVFEDAAVSGGKQFLTRPAGLRLSTAANTGDVLLFAKLDRAFRSTVDCLSTLTVWRARGVRVVFINCNFDTESPMGKFALTIMAGASEWERDMIALRTKEGLAVARARGTIMGSRFMTLENRRTDGGKLVRYVRPEVFAVGLKVVEWRSRGVSWMAIRRTLRDNNVERPAVGIVSVIGKQDRWWTESGIRNLFKTTVLTQLWLGQGKVKWPPGWKKPATLDTSGLPGVTTEKQGSQHGT